MIGDRLVEVEVEAAVDADFLSLSFLNELKADREVPKFLFLRI